MHFISDGYRHKGAKFVFWALQPEFPKIARGAAAEFDQLARANGSSVLNGHSCAGINQLLEIFSLSIANYEKKKRVHVDDGGLAVFTKAYRDTYHRPLTTKGELTRAIEEVMTMFGEAKRGRTIDRKALQTLHDFCLALSNATVVYRTMLQERSRVS